MREAVSLSFKGHTPPYLALGYRMLPFTVPEHTGRIDVTYRCESDLSFGLRPDENPQDYFADIAVFDPRGAEFMGRGYRGSTGNARTTIFIAPNEATPGYTAGELYPGEWQIMLGFYKVAPGGCDYEVSIPLTEGDSRPSAELPARLPLRSLSDRPINANHWYKGDLHCHTFHSDGKDSPLEVIQMAEQFSLDFLAITDHNTFTQQIEMSQAETNLMLIPGCEVTTFRGHWNIWGDAGWVDFRVTTEDQMAQTIRDAVRQGYLTSCNHPRPDGPPWRFPEVEGYQCVEVWNGPWRLLNDTCLAFWEARINAGQRLVAVGGSDCHNLDGRKGRTLARPTTYVYWEREPSPAAIISALRSGHAFITQSPNGPQLHLTSGAAMMGDIVETPAAGRLPCSIRVIDGQGLQLELWTARGLVAQYGVESNDATFEADIDVRHARYVRAQLRDLSSSAVTALTNPIFVVDAST